MHDFPGLDPSGFIAATSASTDTMSPYASALAYWSQMDAPVAIVARALRRDVSEVAAGLAGLADAPRLQVVGYPSGVPWEQRTVTALVRRGLSNDPALRRSGPIVTLAGEGALDVAELRAAVSRAAAGLRAAGVSKGSRVAVDATQRIESLIIVAATLLLGAVVVRLSLVSGVDGVRTMLACARPSICFTALARQIATQLPTPAMLVTLETDGTNQMPNFADWLDSADPDSTLPDVLVAPDDLALIGFTSGSTGQPKLVETSHLAVFRSTEAMVAMFGFGPDDVFCTSTDFSALSAFRSMLTVPLLCCGRIVLPSAQGREHPLALAQDCAAHGVTRLTAIPGVLRGLAMVANRLPPGSMRALKTVFSGSGVLDQATHDAVQAGFGAPVIDYYGGREFATALYADPASGLTVSSGGGLICNCLIRVVDDEGTVLPDRQIGEIMVHSDCLTASELAGTHPDWKGWHQTGDLGLIAGPGLVQVVGRRRDVIKAADGSLVFPSEIEALLNEAPEIRESCVMGWIIPDGRERIIAAVRLPEDAAMARLPAAEVEARLRAHVLARAARFRVPERVIVVDDFPRIGTEKINKAALRSRLAPYLSES